MRKLRKFCSIVLVVVFAFSLTCPVAANELPYTDVSSDDTYYDAIKYVYDHGIMTGVSSTSFGGSLILNRAQLVTILYRISGSEEEIDPVGFTDVPEDTFYYYPVGWAQENGIVQGFTETKFGPTVTLTNQQLVTFLYRYVDSYKGLSYYLPEPNVAEGLDDYSSVLPFAQEALNWAMNCGVVSSTASNCNPNQEVSRSLCAHYLYQFLTLALSDAKALTAWYAGSIPYPGEPGYQDSEYLDPGDDYYFPDYWPGETIATYLTEMGYTATWQCVKEPLAIEFALYNSEVIYVNCHGMDGYISFDDGDLLYTQIDSIAMMDCDLAYISACYAGGTFCEELYESGAANCVVGYTESVGYTVGYPGNLTGVYAFEQKVFDYVAIGMPISEAITQILRASDPNDVERYDYDSVYWYGDF